MSWLEDRLTKLPAGRVYILPTRYGFLMGMGFSIMLITSNAFSNNIAFLLTFLVFSLFLLSLFYAHLNLSGLRIVRAEDEPAAPGEEGRLTLELERLHGESMLVVAKIQSEDCPSTSTPFAVTVGENARISLRYRFMKRGVFLIPRVLVSSVFPLGVFRAWMVFDKLGHCHVHPRSQGSRGFPLVESKEGESLQAEGQDGWDDFGGHLPYSPGQSQRLIDWKASARSREKLMKKYVGGLENTVMFHWQHVVGLPRESGLEQLTAWVMECDRKGLDFGLELPGGRCLAGSGRAHVTRCLKLLAEA